MKFLILITALSCFSKITSCQNWAPIGTKWTYEVRYAYSPRREYKEWTSIKDTLVGGQTCKLIERTGSFVTGDLSNKMITYEDSNRVYWYNTFTDQFTVLYDFNKNPGDTWVIEIDTCDLLITVDSISIDTINGFALKALYISSDDSVYFTFYGKILQHIGYLGSPSPDVTYHCYKAHADYNGYAGLRCYEDSILGFHNFGIAPSCKSIIVGMEELNYNNGLSIFPNPVSNKIKLKPSDTVGALNYEILNYYGQAIKTGIIDETSEIEVSELQQGFYVLIFFNDKLRRVMKIIKE